MTTEIAMLHDVEKCTACRACMVACKQWKNLPAEQTPFNGEFQSHESLSPDTLILIKMIERMENDEFNWDFIKFQCLHCGDPACVKACPEEALYKKDNGIVAFDADKCVGCSYCVSYCPFGVPVIDTEKNLSTKCNLCVDRVEEGMVPSCALTCTADAILFGTREEMTKIAHERLAVLKETYPNAQLYGVDKNDGVGGTAMMYVLPDKPSVYGLPENPVVPTGLTVFKDWVRPAGKMMLGATVGAVTVAALSSAVLGRKVEEDLNAAKGPDEE